MNLRSQTINSISWTSFARLIKQISQFILSIFLMRLLGPDAYGLIGMALVFIGFANIFQNFGFGSALIQRSLLAKSHYSSTFFLNIGIGMILTTTFILVAPLISLFYGNEDILKVIQVLSFSFLFASLGIVPKSLMQRRMRFDIISKIEIITTVIPGIIAVILAFMEFGVWALVFQNLMMILMSSILYLKKVDWKPTFIFSWRSILDLWQFSANLTGYNLLNYWARSADDLLIGKYIGSVDLGYYTRAYSLMLLPISQVISVISQVMFSGLSKIQREKERVKQIYLKANQVLAFITFPMMTGLFVVAEPFVITFFGQKWSGVIPLIQILTIVGITQTISNPTGWIYTSQGRTDWMFWWGVFASTSIILAIGLGVWLGNVEDVAMAYAIVNMLLTYPCISIPGRLIGMSFLDVFKKISPSLTISLMMASIVYLSNDYLIGFNVYLRLIILVLIGGTIYVSFAKLFSLEAYRELKKIMIEITIKRVSSKMNNY